MMVEKALASALVLAAALGLGRLAARPYQLRVRTLEEWQRLVRHLVPLISWKRMPLAEALSEAARGQPLIRAAMAQFVRRLHDRDGEFASYWAELLKSLPGLWEEDRVCLLELGRVLGMSDAVYQEEHLTAAARELERLTGEARAVRAKDGRLVPVMVSAMGVMVVILML